MAQLAVSVSRTFDKPYYTGTTAAVSHSAVTPWDVVINGKGYLIDLQHPQAPPYGFKSIPMLRAMFLQDRGTAPIGEHSLNPDDYWRRSVDDWSAGAGQLFLDHHDSLTNRFRASKGCDPWTNGSVGLLPDTDKLLHPLFDISTANAVVAGANLYVAVRLVTNQEFLWTATDLTGLVTTVTAGGSDADLSGIVGITTDGFTVWVADGTRVHYTTRGSATYDKFHTSDHVCELIRSAKGRLFTAKDNVLYKHTLTGGSAVATAYYTHPNPDWTWTDIAGGPDSIYFSGFSGDKSAVYSATLKTDATDLDPPVVVETAPDGEIVRTLQAYEGVLVIGTDKGFRIGEIGGSSGQLVIGSQVLMDNPPMCFEPQDRFVWFGWTNYDTTSTGLGRIDLSTFNSITTATGLGIPAYASDLMVTGQGQVTSVVTFLGKRVFTITGLGVWMESANRVPTGTVSSGWLNYELADPKVAIKLNVQYRKGAGTIATTISADDRVPITVGVPVQTSAVAGNSAKIPIPQLVAHNYEVTFTLDRSPTDATVGPVIDRFTLMVEPQPERRFQFIVPLRMHETEQTRLGNVVTFSPSKERERFKTLCESREVCSFQDIDVSYQVVIDDVEWVPYEQVGTQRSWDGCLVLTTKLVN